MVLLMVLGVVMWFCWEDDGNGRRIGVYAVGSEDLREVIIEERV